VAREQARARTMSPRRNPHRPADILSAIKAKMAEIATLQGRIDGARATLASYLESVAKSVGAVQIAARAVRPATTAVAPPARRRRRGGRQRRGRARLQHSPTAHDAATIIRAAGRPLHVSAILTAMARKGRAIRSATLVSCLARWVRSRAVFYRARPNTFGLLEMRTKARSSRRRPPRG